MATALSEGSLYRGLSVFSNALRNLEILDFDIEVETRRGEKLWVSVSTLIFEDSRHNRRMVVYRIRDISRRSRYFAS